MYFTTEPDGAPALPFYATVLGLVCVLILVVNGASLFHNLSSLNGANAVQGQTAKVSDKLQNLNVLVMDAESSMRGYFLSGSDVYLGPMRTASAREEAPTGMIMNSWKSIGLSACAPPLMMFIIGTGSVRAEVPPT